MDTVFIGLFVTILAGALTGVWKAVWQAFKRFLTPPPPPPPGPQFIGCTFILDSKLTAGANITAGGLPSQVAKKAKKRWARKKKAAQAS